MEMIENGMLMYEEPEDEISEEEEDARWDYEYENEKDNRLMERYEREGV